LAVSAGARSLRRRPISRTASDAHPAAAIPSNATSAVLPGPKPIGAQYQT